MSRDKAKFTAITGERICRVDLNDGEIDAQGIERDKCKKLLRSLLED